MTDLRAPDPTLTAHDGALLVDDAYAPGTAHRWTTRTTPRHTEWRTDCGAKAVKMIRSEDAAWFAVPCRECFPEAPNPGYRRVPEVAAQRSDPGLAWQVTV